MPSLKIFFSAALLFFVSFAFGQKKIGDPVNGKGPFELTVIVEDADTKKPLESASVLVEELATGDISNDKGRVQLLLEPGTYTLQVSYLGYETLRETLIFQGPGIFRARLTSSAQTMEEVVVKADADRNVKSTDLGRNVLSIETIEALPPFVGEADILKSITLLPGVSVVGEASAGFNVRGSSADQNLILLGGAPLYNPSHLFGYFSAFNTDLIQSVDIFKGGIPANYGGRAASIIDLRLKRGNTENWEGKASLGLVSAKASAGGPVFTDKLTLMAAGRASYSNWILKQIKDPDIANSSASFYDLNAIVDYDIAKDFSLRYTFYHSADDFQLVSDTTFNWSNLNHTLTLQKSFNHKLQLTLTGVMAGYENAILDESPFSSFELSSKIEDKGLNFGAKYFVSEGHDINIGLQTKSLTIHPGEIISTNPEFPIDPFTVDTEKATESAIYLQHNFELGRWIGISYGLRYNRFRLLGPAAVPVYDELLPRAEENIIEFTEYGDGDVVTEYTGFEPRLAMRLSLDENTSVKLGYNKMFQYIHLISNTTTIAPTDVWKLSDPYIKPQEVEQYSAGLFRNFANNSLEASIEAFYKNIKNLIDYKDGATLLLNNNLESDLLNGQGYAYGLEFYLEKKTGNLTGWISYTYSRSQRRIVGSFPEEIINQGDWYPANYDKPHILSLVGNYKLGKQTKLSAIFTYSTGRPVSYPSAKFNYFNGENIAYYDRRNGFRAPDYNRLDLSLTIDLKNKKKWLAGELVFSIYNVYGRKNAFSVFFDDIPGSPPQAFRLSVMGVPFPSVNYQFDF